MIRPDFDSINNYEQFKKYSWSRTELKDICKEHGLLFVGSEKKLNKVIEAYFNRKIIPPRRNWYTNKVLLSFVNENGSLMGFNIVLLVVNLIITVIGIINMVRGTDDLYYIPNYVFGITGLIVAVLFIYWDQDLNVILSYFPLCGDKRFTRAQVDEQANSAGTECLDCEDILLAPDMLIGVTNGIAAVAYEDIASIQVRQSWHTERIGPRGSTKYREFFTYKIVVMTNKGKRIAISNSRHSGDVGYALKYKNNREGDIVYAEKTAKRIYEQCLKYNPHVKLHDTKKSSMATDHSMKQITEGEGVRHSVDKALEEQFLIKTSAGEDLKKRFISCHLRMALILIPESLLVSVIAGAILYVAVRYIHTIRGIWIILPAFFFFPYAIYNFCSSLRTIRKDDIEFYSGEIIDKNKDGYFIKGVNGYRFGFIKKMMPDREPAVGDHVILARFKNEFSLISSV